MKQEKDIRKLVSGYKVPATKTKAEAWEQLTRKISEKEQPKKEKIRRLPYYISAAAAAAILVIFFSLNSLQPVQKAQNTQLAAQQTILPDSSTVVLKTNSSIKYHERLIDGARLVKLDGEAFFEVTKGKKFQVDFPGGEIEVLGTKFNIQAYSKNVGRVDCYEGAVRLTINKNEFLLTRGKAISFTPNSIDGPFDFSTDVVTNISNNLYHWADRPLREILTLICAREGYQLQASETILGKRFTGSLNLNNSKLALTILTKAMNLDYDLTNKQLSIVENN
ncbi:FecR family protein [Mangrovibacterium lignilyticum]|uniref:FecR family protein n=1 Tax=Mangrovibacterium lignilyticum TaxID=2668052 RepID=UPI0013D6A81C|nr:FecR family protein [Mangrovibacterium lignilyticum]